MYSCAYILNISLFIPCDSLLQQYLEWKKLNEKYIFILQRSLFLTVHLPKKCFDVADLEQLSRMQRTQERGCVAVHSLSIFTVGCSRILSRFLKNTVTIPQCFSTTLSNKQVTSGIYQTIKLIFLEYNNNNI